MLQPSRLRYALLAAFILVLSPVLMGSPSASAPNPLPPWDQSYPQNGWDPPSRVARLNYIAGQVSLRPASATSEDDWGTASVNYPLSTGDHVWTERNARAELHLGATVIRLAPETAFAFLNLDDDVVQARVAEGSVDIRVREIAGNETYEIDTPTVAVSLVRPGIYRIDVDPDGGVTRVTVRAGLAEVNGNNGFFSVYAGDSAEVTGAGDTAYDIRRASAPDAWERWCRDRDRREDNRVALRYVSRDMVGYEDLDDYGTWDYVPEYGWTWEPTVVAVDWAPYRYGRWTWIRQWGWTWVDEARWGFAPFHYGRWAHHHNRWVWVPGHYVARPVWAPALVAFVGGQNWTYAFGFGTLRPAVGWFPLGPGELYCPQYRASPVYLRNINVTHVNVTNINASQIDVARLRYANRAVAGAMTAVPREAFLGSQPVQRVGVAVPRTTVTQAPIAGHTVAVTPEARNAARAGAAVPRPPASVARRAVVARVNPPSDVAHLGPVVPLARPARSRSVPSAAQPEAGQSASGARAGETPTAPETRARVRPDAGTTDAGSASRAADSNAARPNSRGFSTWRPGDNAGAPADRPSAAAPREERPATTNRPGGAYARERGIDTGRPGAGRVEQPERVAVPRYERPAESARPATPQYERQQTDDRPGRGRQPDTVRESPAPERPSPSSPSSSGTARSRGDDRGGDRPAPAQAERPSSPPPQPAPAARPGDAGGRRQPPASGGGRGGQSSGSARSRGGRG